MNRSLICTCIIGLLFTGCAHLEFTDFTDGKDGVTYYDPKPYLFVSTNKDCITTATVIVLPEKKRTVKFKTGYGTADLSVSLSNGMITSVDQKTDTKIPETITSIASLGTAAASLMKAKPEPGKQVICTPSALLYPIQDGTPDDQKPIKFNVEMKIIDVQ
ncbi:MAG: hypothetical protein ACLP9S_02685 [Syntrophales bacterium]